MNDIQYICESCGDRLAPCEGVHGCSYECTNQSCRQVYDAAEIEVPTFVPHPQPATEDKHTPGFNAPWTCVPANEQHFSYVIDAEGAMVSVQVRNDRDIDNLIAAAPELLSELRETAFDLSLVARSAKDAAKTDPRWDGVYEKLMERVHKAEATIAKAEGRS